MLLFDDGKRLEKAVGEEAAQVIVSILERLSEEQKKEAATKGDIAEVKHDIRETELRLQKDIEKAKSETIRWTVGIIVAQTAAIIAALVAIMK